MRDAALKSFLFSLVIFAASFVLGHWYLTGNELLFLGYALSFGFANFSLITGIKNIRNRQGLKSINILSVTGAAIITAFYLFFIALFIITYLSPLPVNP